MTTNLDLIGFQLTGLGSSAASAAEPLEDLLVSESLKEVLRQSTQIAEQAAQLLARMI